MEIKRCYDTIIGASVGENQLVQNGATSVIVQNGHKYYAKIDGSEILGTSTGSAITINDSSKDMVIDLSLYLPANIVDYIYSLETATAGSGIAKLREWGFLKGYQAHNAGSIESVEVTGKVVRGFNQWDEEWEAYGSNGQIKSKNRIPVIEGATYYLKSPIGCTMYLFPDATSPNAGYVSAAANNTFIIPQGVHYIMMYTAVNYGTTYNHDICINLSNPDRNGEYEPYSAHTYDYGNDTLRGIFKLDANNNLYADGDVKTADGTITRKYGVVDLGTLTYSKSSLITNGFVATGGIPDDFPLAPSTLAVPEWLNSKGYEIMSNYAIEGASVDKAIAWRISGQNKGVIIRDSAYATYYTNDDMESFKSAMSGVYLVYPLATPTTEQGDPFTSPQVCYPDGTEEYVTSNGVPVGHETRYEL